MTGKAVPQPSGEVGDATLPARGLPEIAKGAWRASMGLSPRIQDDRTPHPQAPARSTACMFPSWHRGHRRNERPVNAS